MNRRSTARIKRFALLTLASSLAIFGLSSSRALADTTWTGAAGDNNWFNPLNWSDGLPDAADNTFNNTLQTINFNGGNASILSFFSNGVFNLNSGILSGALANSASTVQVNNAFTVNGGGLNGLTLLAGSGGQGVSFGSNTNNFIQDVISNANLTVADAGYVFVASANTLNSTLFMTGTSQGLQFRDNLSSLLVSTTGRVEGFGTMYRFNGDAGTLTNNGTVAANVNGQTLRIATQNIAGSGAFSATNGGVLSFGGTVNLSAGNALNVSGAGSRILLNAGTLTGTLTSATGSGLDFSSNTTNSISGVTVGSAGILSLTADGYAFVRGTNTLNGTLLASGTSQGFQFEDNLTSLTVGTIGRIEGYGTFYRFNGDAGTLTNNGTITANQNGQMLRLATQNIGGSGIFDARNNGTLSIGGTFTGNGANITTSTGGIVLVNIGGLSGTFAGSTGSGISFSANTGNFINAANVNGNLTFAGGAYAFVLGNNTLTNGTLFFSGTSQGLQFQDNLSNLTIGTGGNIAGFGTFYRFNGDAGTVTNNGLASANVNAQTLRIATQNIAGSGTFEARNGGTLSLGGTFNPSAGSAVNVADATSLVLVNGGGLTGTLTSGSGSGLSFSSNTTNFIRDATVGSAGILSVTGDGFAFVIGTNVLNGSILMSGTTQGLQFQDNLSTLTVGTTGQITGFGNLYRFNGDAGTVTNNGTIRANTIGQTLRVGTQVINGSGTFAGSSGGTLSIGGVLTGTNAIIETVSGTVLVDGGDVRGSLTNAGGSGLSFSSNTNNRINGLSMAGNLTFGNDAYAFVQGSGNTITNGTIRLNSTSQGLQFQDNIAGLTLGTGGGIAGFGNLYRFNSDAGTLTNTAGTVSANVLGQTLTINVATITNNGGTLEAANGGILTLTPTAALTSSGTVEAQTASTVNVAGGYTQTAGSTIANGTLNLGAANLNLSGGSLNGAGSITAAVFNNSGTDSTVSAGASALNSAGTLTLNGNYTQSAISDFLLELGGTTPGTLFDFFQVNGSVNLAGDLNIRVFNSFTPTNGSSFTFLRYNPNQRTGMFTNLVSLDAFLPSPQYAVLYDDALGTATLTFTGSAVPEGSSGALLAIGVLGAAAFGVGRRRQLKTTG